jgi:hypothetical protein
MKYDIDEANKTISIFIFQRKLKLTDIKFCDVEQSIVHTGDDYNKINASVKASLAKKLNRL